MTDMIYFDQFILINLFYKCISILTFLKEIFIVLQCISQLL